MPKHENPVQVKLTDAELVRLDELRGGQTRPAFFRTLLRQPPDGREVATHEEVLGILSVQARDGSATAAIALEKALRDQMKPLAKKPTDELAEILGPHETVVIGRKR